MMLGQHCHGDQMLELVHIHAALHLIINSLTSQTPVMVVVAVVLYAAFCRKVVLCQLCFFFISNQIKYWAII